MRNILTVARRELGAYFTSPVAYVFLVIFLVLIGFFTFMISGFFVRNEADLQGFFFWLPWLYILLVPAIGMRQWAEERRQGTLELLFTMPISVTQAILGKFLAGWIVLGIALVLTLPMVFTVCYLGDPDAGPILTGYTGSFDGDLPLAGADRLPAGDRAAAPLGGAGRTGGIFGGFERILPLHRHAARRLRPAGYRLFPVADRAGALHHRRRPEKPPELTRNEKEYNTA